MGTKAAQQAGSHAVDAEQIGEQAVQTLLERLLYGIWIDNPEAWVVRVSGRIAASLSARRRQRKPELSKEALRQIASEETDDHGPPASPSLAELIEPIRDRLLEESTPLQRVVLAGILGGHSIKSIARRSGRSPRVVRQARRLLAKKIRRILGLDVPLYQCRCVIGWPS
jgi:DNA-directed RNA polymerase specialized sigma24 family protein